jgi:hypothetical protein
VGGWAHMRTPKEKIADYDFGRHLYLKEEETHFYQSPKSNRQFHVKSRKTLLSLSCFRFPNLT